MSGFTYHIPGMIDIVVASTFNKNLNRRTKKMSAEDYLSTLRGDGDEEMETIEDVEEETMENGAESDGEDNDFGASNTALTDEEKMRIMREQMGDEYVIEDLQPEKKQTYTQEEIRSLTDTKNLFQSPLFRFSVCIPNYCLNLMA